MVIQGVMVIFACLFVGEVVVRFFGLPLPASIIGLLLLFVLLQVGIVKKAWVEQVAKVMMDYLVLLVIPACVSIMQYLQIIRQDFWVLLIATTVSTFLVLLATGKTHEWLRKWK